MEASQESAPPASSNAEPVPDATPTRLAAYAGGSLCELVLQGDALYWVMQEEGPPNDPASSQADEGRSAGSAASRCARMRGAIHRVGVGGGEMEVIARTTEWPRALAADETSLWFLGYCSHGLWSVPRGGGVPVRTASPGARISDHFATPQGVLVADRFGPSPGVFRIDPDDGRMERVAARGRRPWLLGQRGGWVYWAEMEEKEGMKAMVHATQGTDDREVGRFFGKPIGSVFHQQGLLVRTTHDIVRLDEHRVHRVTSAPANDSHGGLAVHGEYVYWADAKTGTLSRSSVSGQSREDVRVGGEPCDVAVDDEAVYWLDHQRHAVMRAPSSVFETLPPAAPAPELGSTPEGQDLEGPPPGLELAVAASLVRVRGGWGVDVKLEAHVWGPEAFDLGGRPTPHLRGEHRGADGAVSAFSDGCTSEIGRKTELTPGDRRTYRRRYGDGLLEATPRGETLTVEVALCHAGLPSGQWVRIPAATIVVEVPERGRPKLRVTPAGTSETPAAASRAG